MNHDYNLRQRKNINYSENSTKTSDVRKKIKISNEGDVNYYDAFVGLLLFVSRMTLLFMNEGGLSKETIESLKETEMYYENRTFFFNKQLPLNGLITYYFLKAFTIEQFQNISMLLGACIPTIMYYTCKNLKVTKNTRILISTLMIFENSIFNISVTDPLNSIYIFFNSLAILCGTMTDKESNIFLLTTSISLSMILNMKLYGLFTMMTLYMRTYSYNTTSSFSWKKAFNYTFYLICIPIMVHIGTFYVHLSLLNESGVGDSFMSSEFQSSLLYSPVARVSTDIPIKWDSVVTLRNNYYNTTLLGNEKRYWKLSAIDSNTITTEEIRNGDIVYIHDDHSIIQYGGIQDKHQYDINEDNYFEIVIRKGDRNIYPIRTKFQLRHVRDNCYLVKNGDELDCKTNIFLYDENSKWNIEEVVNEGNGSKGTISIISKIKELRNKIILHTLFGKDGEEEPIIFNRLNILLLYSQIICYVSRKVFSKEERQHYRNNASYILMESSLQLIPLLTCENNMLGRGTGSKIPMIITSLHLFCMLSISVEDTRAIFEKKLFNFFTIFTIMLCSYFFYYSN